MGRQQTSRRRTGSIAGAHRLGRIKIKSQRSSAPGGGRNFTGKQPGRSGDQRDLSVGFAGQERGESLGAILSRRQSPRPRHQRSGAPRCGGRKLRCALDPRQEFWPETTPAGKQKNKREKNELG